MRKFGRKVSLILLAGLVSGAAFAAFWFGVVPQRFSPFSPLDLDNPPARFVDPRLTVLRRDPALCRAVLKAPVIASEPVPDNPPKNNCGWRNSVKVSAVGGARLGASPLSCEMAAGVALWAQYDLQQVARDILGSPVAEIQDYGTYDCRKMIGNARWDHRMSEHASANALDIAGFTLADGRKISVLRHWKGNGPEARFLREAHRRACRYFRVTLSPDFNAAHRDHFHFDRGMLWTCK